MAWQSEDLLIRNFKAAADLSSNQFFAVKLDSTVDQVAAVTAVTDDVYGVLQDKPDAAGKSAATARSGVTKMKAGGTIALGDRCVTDATGKAVTDDGQAGTKLGWALAAASNNEIFPMELDLGDPAPVVKSILTTITTAQVLALNATPISLVAAPGAGKFLAFEGALLMLDYNSADYAGVAAGEDLIISYTDGSGEEVARIETTGFIDSSADAIRWICQQGNLDAVSGVTPVANAALVISLLSGEITTGDSPLKVRTYYRVLPSTL